MPTSSQWRALARKAALAGAQDLELPSGMRILARRPDVVQLAMWQRLPVSLAAAAAGETPKQEAMRVADVAAVCRQILEYCCVQPRISLDPQGPEEIHPADIPDEDTEFILSWALRRQEAESLAAFRRRRADAGPGGDSAMLSRAPVGADGDRGPSAGSGD